MGSNAQGDCPKPQACRSAGKPEDDPYEYFVRSAEAVARPLAIELVPGLVESTTDIERVIATFAGPDGGLLVLPSGTTTLYRDLVIGLAAKHRLPSVYPFRFYVTAGGTSLINPGRPPPMSIAFFATQVQPSFPCRPRPNT